jgi:hypothetical protein
VNGRGGLVKHSRVGELVSKTAIAEGRLAGIDAKQPQQSEEATSGAMRELMPAPAQTLHRNPARCERAWLVGCRGASLRQGAVRRSRARCGDGTLSHSGPPLSDSFLTLLGEEQRTGPARSQVVDLSVRRPGTAPKRSRIAAPCAYADCLRPKLRWRGWRRGVLPRALWSSASSAPR